MMKRILGVIAIAVVMASCGGNSPSSPTAPTPPPLPNITGTWTGSGTSRVTGGAFSMRVVFSQGVGTGNATLSGTWSSSSTQGPNGGSLSGLITGTSVRASLFTSDPRLCGFDATMIVSGTRMNGDYSGRSCSVTETGSVALTKQ